MATLGIHALDTRAFLVEIGNDVAGVGLRHLHLELHNGFEQHQSSLPNRTLKSLRAGQPKGDLRRVDGVLLAVIEPDLHVHDGIAGQDAALHRFTHAFVNGRSQALTDHTADDVVHELVTLAAGAGRDFNRADSVLTMPTRLLHVPSLGGRRCHDGLAVRDPHRLRLETRTELAPDTLQAQINVRVAHAGEERLCRLHAARDPERQVLFL